MTSNNTSYDADVARTYDDDRQAEAHWHLENDYVRTYMESRADIGPLLDAPIGTGRFLVDYRKVGRVFGVDASESMLALARKRASDLGLQERTTLGVGSMDALPFADRTFGTVVCWRFLHLIPPAQLGSVLGELARVARGEILVQVYRRGGFFQRLAYKIRALPERARHLWRRQRTPWSHIPAYFHTEMQFKDALHGSGLRIDAEDFLCNYQGNVVAVFRLHAES